MSTALLLEFFLHFCDKFFFWVGIIFLVFDLIGKNFPPLKKHLEKVSHHWFLGFSAICFLVASFQAWNEQHERAEKDERRLEELSKPILSSELGELAIAPNGSTGQDSLITLALHIRNQGAPTGIENFNILVSQGAKSYVTELLHPGDTTLFSDKDRSHPTFRLSVTSNLIHSASQPVERNGARDVWVQVYVYGLSRADFLAQSGMRIAFVYQDIATRTQHKDSFPVPQNPERLLSPLELEKQSRLHAAPSR